MYGGPYTLRETDTANPYPLPNYRFQAQKGGPIMRLPSFQKRGLYRLPCLRCGTSPTEMSLPGGLGLRVLNMNDADGNLSQGHLPAPKANALIPELIGGP